MSRSAGSLTTGSPEPTRERASTVSLPARVTISMGEPVNRSDPLLDELGTRARTEGANVGLWPGLAIYRFTRPTHPRWNEIESLSIGIVAQGSGVLTAIGGRLLRGESNYVVIGSRRDFDCRVVEASPDRPALCLVLEVDPQIVGWMSARMGELGMAIAPPGDATGRVRGVRARRRVDGYRGSVLGVALGRQ